MNKYCTFDSKGVTIFKVRKIKLMTEVVVFTF